ncbi:insulinase family protein [Shewanella sp. UCD-KL12]|uniref:insulinase family protein n=1 Tax=Shewanella sp. UCD-KL12 TaxID=1917163 RepID=UPI0009709172|nr:insulinase family protein [Shewanella sp. UCD-KL12]
MSNIRLAMPIQVRLIPLIAFMLTILGCQQTKLVFTDSVSPITPEFNQLSGAPQVKSPSALLDKSTSIWAPQLHQVSPKFTLHLFPESASKLNYIELVLINPNKPFYNIDILSTALNEYAIWLASQHTISCIESLRIQPSMHSINLKMACPTEELTDALSILASSWNSDAFANIDLDNVRRKLKLDKHINAYSGGEINKVWAKLILGEQHPYNQALDDKTLQDELTKSDLVQLQNEIKLKAKWHLFMSTTDNKQPETLSFDNAKSKEALITQATGLAELLAKNSAKYSARNPGKVNAKETVQETVKDENTLFIQPSRDVAAFSNTSKTIYLIDAPGAVQTQVRVGYRLPLSASNTLSGESPLSSSDPLSCQLLASWLGRSFSGRLYYDLREQRGLTYGIYGRCYDNPLSRTLKFYGSTQLQHTGAFVTGILAHLQLASEQSINAPELDALKTYEKSKYTLTMQSQHSMKQDYVKQLTLSRKAQDRIDSQARAQALTVSDVKLMALNSFNKPPYILLRGDADKIRQDLNDKLPDWRIESIKP